MAKKQVVSTHSAAAAAPARAAAPVKSRAARTTAAKHSKAAISEPVAVLALVEEPVIVEVEAPAVVVVVENAHEAISTIAYGYWVARGYAAGNPVEDWVRAEREYLSR